ncbi:MAG: LLM class flavin-dependent oxidoreductase [Planctomycetes bacterium]|nr:LLM class flavin-dependent oxidoreductase [Planctomycetota bacterium]
MLGVTTGTIVGICVPRGVPMVVALLAIQKAGGAYLPLDPEYPSERLSYQVEDAQVPVLVTLGDTSSLFPAFRGAVVRLDEDASRIAVQPASAPMRHLASKDLAYVIYTSGSTGKPKGVMVEHGNVLNFFTGMDQRLGRREGGAWLAVTSLSFDISVLEICWTLTRGLKLVLYTGDDRRASGKGGLRRKLDFSLFYFASDEAEKAHDKYRLLMEGARRADAFGFEAVWSPERHFHAFGGLYPNPAVASAALASITKRIQIRAGSVVLPINDPLRVAEEWSLVDNLSQGRVGIAFASGWQPNDFVLAPQNYADRKQVLMDGIETVRALWRGESIERPLADGRKIAVRTLPRPVQKELPVWLTTAGNVDTWIAAGKIGANVLTHLLGQTVEELREKVEAYRRAWSAAGHGPREGRVTIMLHAFVGDCDHSVRELVRRPMIEYLRSSVGLVKSFVASFPTFKTNSAGEAEEMSRDFEKLSAEDLEAILENAFERYFETSGLFGTLETCERMVERLESVGIDEIACLIDFGVDSELALEHIDHLNRLREHVTQRAEAAQGQSIPELIAAHGITHLQCTPSMAAMILAQSGSAEALAKLELLMIGGEAFPPALARELRAHMRGRIINMYGPTETAIWSSTYELRGDEEQIPIGEPIANTFFLVLDAYGQPVPSGLSGELWIGGTGVARGYLHRAELSAERFVHHPLAAELGAPRLYRTGDIARRRDDGLFEFLGRVDQQVKLRGYRIELGEIEAALRARAGVHEAAVVVRKDASSEPRLLAYVSPKPGAVLAPDALRLELRESLPEFMIPARVMALPELPHTPNQKIDRKALPDPEQLAAPKAPSNTKLEDDLERAIAAIWAEVLTLPSVGRDDNFFDLGGHSLLTVQVQGRLKRQLSVHASITDLFRFPTVRSLADFLRNSGDPASSATTVSAERVQARQEGLDRRRALLQRRQPGRS